MEWLEKILEEEKEFKKTHQRCIDQCNEKIESLEKSLQFLRDQLEK
jgi:hypothetical protein